MRLSVVALALIFVAAIVTAQSSWLPPQAEDGTARQLATRVAEIGVGRTDETRLAAAHQLVDRVRERLESWGEETSDHAPEFAELDVPESGRPSLDAMARFQICNMVLMIQLQDPDFADDEDAKLSSVTGLTAFTLAVLYLRHPFLEAGGADGEIEAFLTSDSMGSILDRIQSEPAARAHIDRECTPPLKALVDPPAQ